MLAAVAVVAALLSVPVSAQALSGVATLDGITVAGGDLWPGFSSDVRFYRVDVAHGEDRATVGFDKGHPAQAVAFEDGSGAGLADVDAGEAGHQVDLAYGANTVRLVVTPADAAAADAAVYTLSIVRAAPAVDGVSADRAPATVVPAGLDGRPVAANEKRLVFAGPELLVPEGRRHDLGHSVRLYSVRLSAKPSGSVSVSVSVPDGTDSDLVLRLSGGAAVRVTDSGPVLTLTFGTSNWNSRQFLTVDAVDDADSVNDFATLRHTASGGGYDNVSADRRVEVIDTDRALVLYSESMTVPEGSHRDHFVRLLPQPSSDVTVSVSVPDGFGSDLVLTDGANSMKVTGSGPVLERTFTSSHWEFDYQVVVLGTHDADDVDDFHTLRYTVSGGGHNFYEDVPVRVADDESGVLVFDSRSVSVTEGSHAEYGVKLGAKPSGPVTVEVSVPGGDDSDLVLSTPSAGSVSVSDSGSVLALTFGTADWDTYQSVRAHADSDEDVGDDFETLRHAVSGDGHDFYADVAVTVEDTDTGALMFSETAVTVPEGSRVGYGVRLSALPSGPVTVEVSASAGGDLVLGRAADSLSVSVSDSGSVLALTFGTGDWDTVQSVRVHADEDEDVGDDTATLRHTATGGGYSGASGDVAVTVEDDDTGMFEFAGLPLSVFEGSRGSRYGVRLSAQPSGACDVFCGGC